MHLLINLTIFLFWFLYCGLYPIWVLQYNFSTVYFSGTSHFLSHHWVHLNIHLIIFHSNHVIPMKKIYQDRFSATQCYFSIHQHCVSFKHWVYLLNFLKLFCSFKPITYHFISCSISLIFSFGFWIYHPTCIPSTCVPQ